MQVKQAWCYRGPGKLSAGSWLHKPQKTLAGRAAFAVYLVVLKRIYAPSQKNILWACNTANKGYVKWEAPYFSAGTSALHAEDPKSYTHSPTISSGRVRRDSLSQTLESHSQSGLTIMSLTDQWAWLCIIQHPTSLCLKFHSLLRVQPWHYQLQCLYQKRFPQRRYHPVS